jgi:fructose-1,6-bisphosphatase/inositol monophosphatase family enzyme
VPVHASSSAGNYRLAMGYVGAYFHQVPTKYDVAASAALISEAGGIVTDLTGKPIDWNAPQITYLGARNKEIHLKLLVMLNE